MGKEFIQSGEVDELLSPSSFSSFSSSSSDDDSKQLPFLALNHVSFVCKSVRTSVQFYEEVLGFMLIKRPSSFDFEGAWLFNYGIGIHLLQAENVQSKKGKINPKDNHISFQCTDMELIMQKLDEMNIEYVTAIVKEDGVTVDQIFFHDPDGYMIEICNCQNLPLLPISSCPLKKLPSFKSSNTISSTTFDGNMVIKTQQCSREVEAFMMENFVLDMMNLSF